MAAVKPKGAAIRRDQAPPITDTVKLMSKAGGIMRDESSGGLDLVRASRDFVRTAPRTARPYLFAFLIVSASAVLAWLLQSYLETTRLSVIFLAGVVIAALRLGAHAAFFGAALATVYFNAFVGGPLWRMFEVSGANSLNVAIFTFVALGMAGLAGVARDQEQKLREREQATNLFFQASRDMSSTAGEGELRQRLADWAARAVGGDVYVLGVDSLVASASARETPPENLVEDLRRQLKLGRWPGSIVEQGWRSSTLELEESAGAVIWRIPRGQHSEGSDALLIEVLSSLASAAIARAKISHLMANAKALKQGEQLMTALLSSVSHDFRTPLAAILASATSLENYGDRFKPEVRGDLLTTIVEESQRLEAYMATIMAITQLEAGVLSPRLEATSLEEIFTRVGRRARPPAGQEVGIGDVSGLFVMADPVLLEQALVNVVENALRFSPPGQTVEITASRAGDEVEITIADHGPGVPSAHLARLFDKFFRPPADLTAGGTGLGLFITRGFIEAMGGEVEARPRTDGASGLCVALTLQAPDV